MDIWQILEIVGAAVGLIYLWLELKANIWLWLAGIVMPLIYILVFYRSGLYADMGIQVWFVLAGVYGWAVWYHGRRRRKKETGAEPQKEELRISHTPARAWLPLAIISAGFFAVIAWILINFTDSTVPCFDSLTTALSITALWMLSRKYAEQWLVWFVVDAVSCGLYIYKGLYYTSALYGLYTLISVYGYFEWLKLMRQGK